MTGRYDIDVDSKLYPPRLAESGMDLGPIHVVGDPTTLLGPCMSVIGARRATPYGLAAAEMAGKVAAECGVTLVSGGAVGCDSAAARAALAAGGKTVVVCGTGADVTYPRSSADVFDAARSGKGAVVSLEQWGQTPRRWAFPKRNRVIAALSPLLFVTEAGVPSGTFGTATAAAELGACVCCVPGSIFSPNSAGTNRLIEDGATIICDRVSLETRISCEYGVARLVSAEPEQSLSALLSALVASPTRPDDLADQLGQGVMTVLATLGDYEAKGMVERLPDGRYAVSKGTLLGEAPHAVGQTTNDG